jgi:two-component system response regulator PilR (NtrC family)
MANPVALSNLHILVVDDEPDLRTLYELTLLREGYQVQTAGTLQDARNLLAGSRFDLVITDMRLPDGVGTELIKEVRTQLRPERCIVITAYGSAENAVESLKAGAFDYLTKPVDLKQFRAAVAAAAQAQAPAPASSPPTATGRSQAERRAVPRRPNGDTALACLAGESSIMQTVKERVVKVARSMAPVMVRGESGTGKELIAQALHANSHRADGPWVAVNCGAIPENLLEAEFFGAKKGAYTGATQDRDGFFKAASGGTLFLDEIGDLPIAMQAKLLRAIQERNIRPLGANQEEPVDVRIVSATHKDLPAEVAAGRFRQDLFYRLNVIDIFIPPLRERTQDLPALCNALLQKIARESGTIALQLSTDGLQQLSQLPLYGNVRELENLLHRAVALSEGDVLQLDEPTGPSAPAPLSVQSTELPPELSTGAPDAMPSDLQSHLDRQEREILVRALNDSHYNRTLAAGRLGLSLRQIRYRIARLKIDVPGSQEDSTDA